MGKKRKSLGGGLGEGEKVRKSKRVQDGDAVHRLTKKGNIRESGRVANGKPGQKGETQKRSFLSHNGKEKGKRSTITR